jgi:hypothetical protein
MQRIATVQQTPSGWTATQYHHNDTLHSPVRERIALCDSQARACAVATGWAEDQGLSVLAEAQFADWLLAEVS